jgi:hypothetical protein
LDPITQGNQANPGVWRATGPSIMIPIEALGGLNIKTLRLNSDSTNTNQPGIIIPVGPPKIIQINGNANETTTSVTVAGANTITTTSVVTPVNSASPLIQNASPVVSSTA